MDEMSPKKAKPEKSSEPQPAVEQPKSVKKPKKEKVKKQKDEPVELPLLVEIGFSFSTVFLILVDVLVAWVSYTAGANWLAIFTRVVVTTVALGFILWLLTMNISNGSIFAAMKTIEEEEEEEKNKTSETTTNRDMDHTAVTEA
jgi:uncharacterized membrane protein YqjE